MCDSNRRFDKHNYDSLRDVEHEYTLRILKNIIMNIEDRKYNLVYIHNIATKSMCLYLLRSLGELFDTWACRIVLRVMHAYAREHMIQHYAYAPVSKGPLPQKFYCIIQSIQPITAGKILSFQPLDLVALQSMFICFDTLCVD